MDSIFTTAVHAGERGLRAVPSGPGRADFTPVATPIYPSVGYIYEDTEDLDAVFAGKRAGPVYIRYGNPTNSALEAAVAALEGGEAALSYGSGMAAIHGALLAAGGRAGTTVVAGQDVYGATYALLSRLLASQGVTTRFVDATDLDAVGAALAAAHAAAARPVALLVETVSNPLLKLADLPRLADLAHAAGAALIVDNTFATPYLCQPLQHAADYVVHSATKYLGGHGDVLGGVTVTSAERRSALNEINKLVGANLGPQEAWLILRGIKTLPLRMARQCENAAQVARWLAGHPKIRVVNYPGLPEHPQHELAARLLERGAFGAMISFDLRDGDRGRVFRFMEALRLVLPATTLGDVYSLVLYPAMSSHRALPPEERQRIGIGDGLVRLSVGIEDPEDIIGDLEQALAVV
ncbi:MAG: aminotransferase class I/II-fold pyridoxal phosphate-dependent enzyme [Chloroflexi bacterium]|nr:aminotransferase class I/II-fold pyridoxal phosphate-dependent enzyme [Chloroflexota bacterium]